MLFNFIVALCIVLVCVRGEAPSTTKVSAKIAETTVNGVEGFNVRFDAPFKFQDYVVGFRYALGNFNRAPESLFARKSFDTGDGSVDVDTEYTVNDNIFSVAAKWTSNQFGVSATANADSKNRMKSVSLKKDLNVMDNNLSLKACYDFLKQKVTTCAKFDTEGANVQLTYDTESADPELTVTKDIDASNSVIPSIKLRSGAMTYGYKRSWVGGSLTSKFHPGDKVSVEWKDAGAAGNWVTTADIPLDDQKNTRVSFAREWNY